MPYNSSRGRSGTLGRSTGGRNGTVTIIEEPVMRNYARMAKITLWVVGISSALLTELITLTILPTLWSVLAALLVGFVVGSVASAAVIAWPVLRVIWWWLPEITIAAVVFGSVNIGWLELTWHHVILALRVIITLAVLGTPAAFPLVRRNVKAVAFCLISRHRIRTCFSEFIITNRYGTLPLILWAKPTPAGERLWIFLRPGLAVSDVQDRADQIAVACWASSIVIELADPSNSALLRIDIKRRDPLTEVTTSPITKLATGFIPRTRPEPSTAPAALDLTDVAPDDVIDGKPVSSPAKTAFPTRPKWPSAPSTVPAQADDSAAGDDVNDWI
jgi:hypothetical protein